MQPEPKKHVSHAIAWSLIALLAGSLAFGIWMYSNQIDTIYTGSTTISVTHKKTAAKPTTATTGIATTDKSAEDVYINSEFGFSFTLPSDYAVIEEYGCEGNCGVSMQIGKKSDTRVFSNTNITLFYNQSGGTLNEIKKNYESGNNDIIKTTSIKIDGQDAYKYEIGGMSSGFHFIAAKGEFNLDINAYPADIMDVKDVLLDDIISSFKFGTKKV